MRRAETGLRVVLSGGGSGGHLVPGLELARALLAEGHSALLLRPGRSVEQRVLEAYPGLAQHTVPLANGRLRLPLSMLRATQHARRALRDFEAQLVVALGGRGALPGALAARTMGLPLVVLEQNLVPGQANRLLARLAQRSFLAFDETREELPSRVRARAVVTGMPLRPEILRRRSPEDRARLVESLGLPEDAQRTLLIVGGSQGARALNTKLPLLLASIPAAQRRGWSFLHISGPGREEEARKAWETAGLAATVLGFSSQIGDLLSLSDLVLCRGGAMTLLELAAAGKPSVVVPYPWHRDDHQGRNAQWFAERGAARVLREEKLPSDEAAAMLAELLASEELLQTIGANAASLGRPDALREILCELGELVPETLLEPS
ncbi:MAG: UDP-N-acetylglucosamine--N-acetylmuramyl-(pentapeptide) pyrophosphoryl-undecaprenol N-acetylglucosamine transferase [Planctomycetota bacterium]|nr:MAG: UDP-N-acetylglucosamine--N-acetylmuramyl-(pentapeptide) pyrophosphoryl-undecaprenol N-acetylglucosamine transferase [Planctomycetota bacterium]